MKSNIHKLRSVIGLVVIIILLLPQITLAVWWKPSTWKTPNKTKIIQKATTTPIKNEVEELKNQLKIESTKRKELESKIKISNQKREEKKVSNTLQSAPKKEDRKSFITPGGVILDSEGNVLYTPPQEVSQPVSNSNESQYQSLLQATRELEAQKIEKLNSINLETAQLNAKYAEDMANCSQNAETMGYVYGCERETTRKYNNSYNILKAEYDMVKYAN